MQISDYYLFDQQVGQPIEGSIRVFIPTHHVNNCTPNDLHIQKEAPVFDVPDIVIYSSLHVFDLFRFSPTAIHLSPTGDSGFGEVTDEVLFDHLMILLIKLKWVWPRTNDGHLPYEHIKHLR